MGSTPRDAPCTPSRRPTRTHDAREENHKRCGVRIILYHHNVRTLTIHGRSLPLISLICPAPTCLVCLACATSTAVPACRREIINDKRMNGGRRGRATPTPSCHLAPVNEARHTPRAHWTTLVATRFHNYDFDFIATSSVQPCLIASELPTGLVAVAERPLRHAVARDSALRRRVSCLDIASRRRGPHSAATTHRQPLLGMMFFDPNPTVARNQDHVDGKVCAVRRAHPSRVACNTRLLASVAVMIAPRNFLLPQARSLSAVSCSGPVEWSCDGERPPEGGALRGQRGPSNWSNHRRAIDSHRTTCCA